MATYARRLLSSGVHVRRWCAKERRSLANRAVFKRDSGGIRKFTRTSEIAVQWAPNRQLPHDTRRSTIACFLSTDNQQSSSRHLLGIQTLRQIKLDLKEADVNDDGRIDFEELKLILQKYSEVFFEDDINAIGELFYVGKDAKSVSHTTFLRAMQQIHGGDSRENPLQLQDVPSEACFIRNTRQSEPFANTQSDFDGYLVRYIEEIIKRSDVKDEPT